MKRGNMVALLNTHLPGIPRTYCGKVRDVYDLGGDQLLIVTTDRLSAFDVVLGSGIPGRGIVLTQMSLFWYKFLSGIVPNHLITANFDEYPVRLQQYRNQLEGRSMIVHKANMIPIECVVRGYLSGSGWKDYLATSSVCGITLRVGLLESSKLDQAIFTPSTKAPGGEHDENIPMFEVQRRLGDHLASKLEDLSLAIYNSASEHALKKGIIIADTKFEFGWVNGKMVLCDEVLTPDSSRFWFTNQYQAGATPPSLDKQPVRDYLKTCGWNMKSPGPVLPERVIEQTVARYREAHNILTDNTFGL